MRYDMIRYEVTLLIWHDMVVRGAARHGSALYDMALIDFPPVEHDEARYMVRWLKSTLHPDVCKGEAPPSRFNTSELFFP